MTSSETIDPIELMYETGWTDGLTVVPPTSEKVTEFVIASGRDADTLIAELPPLGGKATIERIAVNAVMAGCLPEYMPVVIAAVQALMDSFVQHSGQKLLPTVGGILVLRLNTMCYSKQALKVMQLE